MKTGLGDAPATDGAAAHEPRAAPIVQLAQSEDEGGVLSLARARAFAEPLLAARELDTGEDALAHADGVAAILAGIGAAPSMCAASYLVYAGDFLQRPEETVAKAFGPAQAGLVATTRKLVQIQRAARNAALPDEQRAQQIERVRRMLLAFSRDLRVVLLRLASRLQTLRFYASTHRPCPGVLAYESLHVFAPLANRLGIWQIKWELEDLAFRFLDPEAYRRIARLLDETRVQREARVEAFRQALAAALAAAGIAARVEGRPKHIYSICKKMRGKHLDFDRVLDVRAMRVIVGDVAACYAALACVHARHAPLADEFDDYIARPKPNGYQSLHTVVADDAGRPVEIQIRTAAMHEHAEHGVAAHWAYKEAGVRGYAGVSAGGAFDAQVAEARKAVLRQLLAWQQDFAERGRTAGADAPAAFDDHIYVFTPQATVIELPRGATPIDFAYAVHTEIGHRCRGAKVDGLMVPLNTGLASGQTVEVTTARDGGPSLDWLNAELGFLRSPRSRAKVRGWFNLQAQAQTIARGREAVEKLLQREGRTALRHDQLATQLGFDQADALFEAVGKDEFSLRTIEGLLRPAASPPDEAESLTQRRADDAGVPKGGVLVVGMDSLLTSLSRCCRPAPPDAIGGYVTRGKGVAIHRSDCSNFRQMARSAPERLIDVAWGVPQTERPALYALDVAVEAVERPGLLRDVVELFSRTKMNVSGVNTQPVRGGPGGCVRMVCTVEVHDAARLGTVLRELLEVSGVLSARRR